MGVGADFDGMGDTPEGLEGVDKYPALLAELARRGWTDEDLAKVAGGNLLRALREAEDTARRLQAAQLASEATIAELDKSRSIQPQLMERAMQLVQATDDGQWGLLGRHPTAAALVAGGLGVWAARIANGEGPWALPLTGQWVQSRPLRAFDMDRMFRRLIWSPDACLDRGVGIAAVVGVSLEGRRNPFRSVLGYVGVSLPSADQPAVWGPILVTREDVGDDPPMLLPTGASKPDDAITRLRAANEAHGLATGDVVVLGAAHLSGAGWHKLRFAEGLR